jgi:dTDP-4-amino-4,6-dideoxygalactose transaminase
MIKFFGVDRLFDNYSWRLTRRAKKVWRTGQVLQGPELKNLEEQFCKKYKRKYAVAVGSATDGLYFAMKALNLNKSSTILCPVMSFIATSNAVKRLGAKLNFNDVDENGNLGNIKFQQKPNAVVYVNLYGNTADYGRIRNYCDENRAYLIEDAAQSQGASYRKTPSGRLGDISVFSFDPTKNLPCFGSGGMVLTDSEIAYEKLISLRRHGVQGANIEYGYNSLIPEDHCAQLSFLLDKFKSLQKERKRIAEWYYKYLPYGDFVKPQKDTESSYHKFVIKHPKRDQLKNFLDSVGIETKIHYDKILDPNNVDQYPNAIKLSNTVLSLPIYPFLKESEVKFICERIKQFDGF